MIEGLRGEIISFINEDPDEYHIKDNILSDYCDDVLRGWRYITDQSWGMNEENKPQFLSFWIDAVGKEDSRYETAFVTIKIGEKSYSLIIDGCIKSNFYSVEEFADEVIRLEELANNINTYFNSLRPVYNV